MRTILRPGDLTVEDLQAIEDMAEGLAGRVEQGGWGELDWDDILNRLERYLDIDLGDSMESPAIKNIQKIIRGFIRESLT